MTDNETVKAFECCTGKDGRCEDCPYEECFTDDKNFLLEDALDLINRQKAEIETWKKNCDDLYEEMSERQKTEVEIAKRMGKSKAVKEFAERLKRKFCTIPEHHFSWIGVEWAIDDLVKEMTGETK